VAARARRRQRGRYSHCLGEDLTPDGFSAYHVLYAQGQAGAGNWAAPIALHQDSAYLELTGAAGAGSAPLVGVGYLPWACDENGNNCAPLDYRGCHHHWLPLQLHA